jgi:hypothetical protein
MAVDEHVLVVEDERAELGVGAVEGRGEGFVCGEGGVDGVEEATVNVSGSAGGDCGGGVAVDLGDERYLLGFIFNIVLNDTKAVYLEVLKSKVSYSRDGILCGLWKL